VRGGKVPGAGLEETLGWGGKLGVFDGGAIASQIDGVHDSQSAAYAEDEAEEDTDERAGYEVHDEPMVCPVLPSDRSIRASCERLSCWRGTESDFSGVA
jgi:hypothetical protein